MSSRLSISRRRLLATAAAAPAAYLAAPWVRRASAAGTLSVGLWDHWVPGANDAAVTLIEEWSEREGVPVSLDFITSQGNKLILTQAAEAQAKSGHDVLSFGTWYLPQYRNDLEPMDDVVDALRGQYGEVNATVQYLGYVDGFWSGMPFTAGSQMKGPCSRADLLMQHAGIDIKAMYPAGAAPQADDWTMETFMAAAKACHAGGNPFGIGLGVTSDSVDSIGAFFNAFGGQLVNESGDIVADGDGVRAALEYLKELGPLLAPDAPAWDDASNNKWLVSGQGSMIWNPPSAWAVAVRDAPEIAQNLWTHGAPSGPNGRYSPFLPYFLGVWRFSQMKDEAKSLLTHLGQESSALALVEASSGYDIPAFEQLTKFDTWSEVGPPPGTLYHYPDPHGTMTLSISGAPAPHNIAQQIFTQGVMTKMVVRQMEGESMERTISWASNEIEGFMRT
ncbi:MAG: extracellular solute-binding protein [Pseudomonadota bacterium]